jgi:hypothetical protein
MKRRLVILSMILIAVGITYGQEKEKKITLTGYLTSMESVMYDSLSGDFMNDFLLHNRLNLKGYFSDNITFVAELRNRFFTGDMAKLGRVYQDMIGNDKGLVGMSWNIVKERSFFINTTLDRVWLDFNYDKFQARIGSQRINWGQALVWNPNDIFNTYSFFDVDYIERPGSDAVRLQYYPSSSSAFELAVKADVEKNVTAAGLYRFNKWGYDIQFLAGYSGGGDLVGGLGWSGSIGSVSFRGEGTWFKPVENFNEARGTIIATTGIDKIFSDNSVMQLQVMYCNRPLAIDNFVNIYTGSLSAKELAFSKFTSFGQFTWAATPLLNIGCSAMWFPDLKGYFAGPSLDFSMAENVDFSLIWQHFDGRIADKRSKMNLAFLRLKYSF